MTDKTTETYKQLHDTSSVDYQPDQVYDMFTELSLFESHEELDRILNDVDIPNTETHEQLQDKTSSVYDQINQVYTLFTQHSLVGRYEELDRILNDVDIPNTETDVLIAYAFMADVNSEKFSNLENFVGDLKKEFEIRYPSNTNERPVSVKWFEKKYE